MMGVVLAWRSFSDESQECSISANHKGEEVDRGNGLGEKRTGDCVEGGIESEEAMWLDEKSVYTQSPRGSAR